MLELVICGEMTHKHKGGGGGLWAAGRSTSSNVVLLKYIVLYL
jgi:hypothetical protein